MGEWTSDIQISTCPWMRTWVIVLGNHLVPNSLLHQSYWLLMLESANGWESFTPLGVVKCQHSQPLLEEPPPYETQSAAKNTRQAALSITDPATWEAAWFTKMPQTCLPGAATTTRFKIHSSQTSSSWKLPSLDPICSFQETNRFCNWAALGS